MIHENVHKETVTGVMVDTDVERHKSELIRTMQDQLRAEGYIPLLDMDPQFTVDYDFEKDCRVFTLSVFGVKGEDVWEHSGVFNGRPVAKSTTSPKSPPS